MIMENMMIYRVSRELRDELEPSYIYPGFYRHPVLRDIFLSPLGVCLSKSKCTPLKIGINGHGYYTCSSLRGSNLLHRAVAETFLKIQIPGKDIIVNHRDGVKTNPSVINLEWCDHRYNMNHAYESGLRSDNKHVDVRNLETGEIVKCRSIGKAAEIVGVNQGRICSHLNRGLHRQYTVNKIFEVKYTDEDWILTKNSIGKDGGPGSKGVVVRKLGTKQYFLFTSAPHAANYLNIKPHMLYSHLNGGSVDMRKHGYEVWYMVDIDVPITEMIDMRKPRPVGHVPRKVAPMVSVLDTATNKTTIYNSLREFTDKHSFNKDAVVSSIYLTGKYKKFVITYI